MQVLRMVRWHSLKRLAMLAGHKALFTLEINGETRFGLVGICTICIGLNISNYRDEGQLRGWKSIHITDGDHPYMKNWWVPGAADRGTSTPSFIR